MLDGFVGWYKGQNLHSCHSLQALRRNSREMARWELASVPSLGHQAGPVWQRPGGMENLWTWCLFPPVIQESPLGELVPSGQFIRSWQGAELTEMVNKLQILAPRAFRHNFRKVPNFLFFLNCCSITVFCIFSPPLHPTPR